MKTGRWNHGSIIIRARDDNIAVDSETADAGGMSDEDFCRDALLQIPDSERGIPRAGYDGFITG